MSNSKTKILLFIYEVLKDNEIKSTRIDHLLTSRLTKHNFSDNDLRFIHKIIFGVIRSKRSLDYHIEKIFDGKYKKLLIKYKILLRMGLYQIHFMNSVPDYASVSTIVDLTKKIDKHKVSLINAVLRRLTNMNNIDHQQINDFSIKYNHPDWMIDRWAKQFDRKTLVNVLNSNNREPIIWFRVNVLKTSYSKIESMLNKKNIFIQKSNLIDNYFKSESSQKVLKSGLIKKDFISVQNPSNGLVVKLLNPSKKKIFFDGCSAPGGKMRYLNELTGGKEIINSYDNDTKRIKILKNYILKNDMTNINCQLKDLSKDQIERFDEGLIDVPCSGTGVISKRVDLKWRRKMSHLNEMVKIQTSIISNVSNYVNDYGVLVYSTCSIEEEENWQIIDNFLNSNNNFELDNAKKYIPEKFVDKNGCMSILPQSDGMDGIFAARLIKK